MKKKGGRSIPDFLRQRRESSPPAMRMAKGARPSVPRVQVIKPQATSAKSGRRGQ